MSTIQPKLSGLKAENFQKVQKSADAKQIPLSVYSGCNHSLESGDILRDITILEDVMQKTAQFIQ